MRSRGFTAETRRALKSLFDDRLWFIQRYAIYGGYCALTAASFSLRAFQSVFVTLPRKGLCREELDLEHAPRSPPDRRACRVQPCVLRPGADGPERRGEFGESIFGAWWEPSELVVQARLSRFLPPRPTGRPTAAASRPRCQQLGPTREWDSVSHKKNFKASFTRFHIEGVILRPIYPGTSRTRYRHNYRRIEQRARREILPGAREEVCTRQPCCSATAGELQALM